MGRARPTGPPSPASRHDPSSSATSTAAAARSTPSSRSSEAEFQGRDPPESLTCLEPLHGLTSLDIRVFPDASPSSADASFPSAAGARPLTSEGAGEVRWQTRGSSVPLDATRHFPGYLSLFNMSAVQIEL